MKRRLSGLVVLITTIVTSMLGVQDSAAQSLPSSIRPSVDDNGVELRTGTIQFAPVELSIGQPGAGGLTHQRFLSGYDFLTNYRAVVGKQASVGGATGYTPYSVLIGQVGETYKKSNSSTTSLFVSDQGTPNTLTRTPSGSSTPTSYTYTTADGVAYTFSTSIKTVGLLAAEAYVTSVALPTGEVRTYNYLTTPQCTTTACGSTTPLVRLQSITNNFGYQIKFLYANNSNPVPVGFGSEYGRMVGAKAINMSVDYCAPTAADCTGTTQTWPSVSYSGTAVLDGSGNPIYTYDPGSGTQSIRFNGNTSNDITYTMSGNNLVVTRGARSWNYNFASGASESTTTVTAPGNRVSTYVFDNATGSIKRFTNAAGEVTEYLNDTLGRQLTITLPTLQTVQYSYDARGNTTQIKKTSYPAGSPDLIWTANYDTTCSNLKKCNKPNWVRDPALNTTTYTYHASSGEVATVTLPAVNGVAPVITNTYTQLYAFYKTSAGGSPAQAATPAWFLTRTAQCKIAATCTATSSDQIRTDIDYGPGTAGTANNRLPVSTTVRSGDAASLVATTSFSYDAVGNTVSVDGPLSGTVDKSVVRYDARRRVIGQVGPDPDDAGPRQNIGSRTIFDARGLPATVEVGNLPGQSDSAWSSFVAAISTTTEFDAEGRATKTSVYAGGAPQSVTQVSYDSAGRLDCSATRMNPSVFGSLPGACASSAVGSFGPDRIVKYGYDAGDRTTSVTSGYGQPNAITQYATYTAAGVATQSDGNGNKTSYEYDAYGRLFRIKYPDRVAVGSSNAADYEEFQYNVNSQITSTRRRNGDTIYTPRDAWGRVTVKDVPNGTAEDVYFSYNNQSQVLSALYNNVAGNGIGQTYDSLGRVATRTMFGKQIGYQYDLAGRRTQLIYPDSPSFFVSYEYTNLGELKRILENGVTELAVMSFDNLGARSSLTRPANGTSTTYVPDALKRLQQITNDLSGSAYDTTTTFAYSPAGQVVSKSQSNDAAYTWTPANPNSTVSSQFDGRNRLTQFNGTPVGYLDDVNSIGNGDVRSGINNLTYSYDALGQLRGATGGPNSVGVDYDPAGMLRKITNGSTVTEYLYDDGDLIAEYVGGVISRRYVHASGSDEPLVAYDGSGLTNKTFLYADERGSVVTAANTTGIPTTTVKYSSYGDSTSLASAFGYTGQRYLPELQLYYYKARMYSPQTGRFLQPDPTGYADGMNLYGYVGGDPINRVDPSGSCFELKMTRYLIELWTGNVVAMFPLPDLRINCEENSDSGGQAAGQGGGGNTGGGTAGAPQSPKPGGRCSVASLGTAKIGLGAQVGFNVKVDGIASLHGDINLWSKSQSSDEWFGRTEQSFGGGLSVAGIGVLVDSRRSVTSFSNQSLSSAGWVGPNPSVVVGLGSRIPGASPELSAPGHDAYFGIGVKALAGLELQINLSEARRRLFGGDDCP